jgi:uncharacterized membrane protein
MPIHPELVHLPVGVALVVPLVALGLALALWKQRLPTAAFGVVVGLQVVALGGGFASYVTGGQDQEKVQKLVPEKAIEAHEEAAELFLWGQVLALVLSSAVLLAQGNAAKVAPALAVLAALGVAGLAARAGHRGGELVYRSGAAAAHQLK